MKKRITIEDRILIENLLKLNYKLKDISNIIECESSTISREIKKKELLEKVFIKNVKRLKDFLMFVMDVQVNLIVERKNIIITMSKRRKIIIIFLNIHELV